MLALQQGELDMTATSNIVLAAAPDRQWQVQGARPERRAAGRQARAAAGIPERAARCLTCLPGKLDPIAQKSFDHWRGVLLADKWLGLPPAHAGQRWSKPIARPTARWRPIPSSSAQGRRISEVFAPMTDADIRSLVQDWRRRPARGDRVPRQSCCAGRDRLSDGYGAIAV